MVAKNAAERKRKQRKLDAEDPERKHRKLDSLFMFNCVEVAIILDNRGNVWFKGVDLARALEMEDVTSSVSHYIDEKYTQSYEKLTQVNVGYRDIPGMHPKTTFVNETGMNLFVIRSRMPRAEAFAEWVCSEVLPSIRKTGKYEIQDPNNNPYKELNEYLKTQLEELKSELKIKERNLKDREVDLQEKDKQLSLTLAQLFSMRPSCIAPLKNELKEEYVLIYRKYNLKNIEDIQDNYELLNLPYYAIRVQLDSLKDREVELKKRYPDLELLLKFKLPNSVNFFNYIMEEMKSFIERGKGTFSQSFRVKEGSALSEEKMLRMIQNLHRYQYGEK